MKIFEYPPDPGAISLKNSAPKKPFADSSVPPLISTIIHLAVVGLQPSKNCPPPVRSFSTAQRSTKPGKEAL